MVNNHFRELIEAAEQENIFIVPVGEPSDEDFEAFEANRRLIIQLSEQAVCFDIGKLENLYDFKIIPELLKFPFPVCWFEIGLEENNESCGHIGILMQDASGGDQNDQARFMVFHRYDRKWYIIGVCHFKKVKSDVFISRRLLDRVVDVEFLKDVERWLFKFLSALNCCNIKSIEEKAPIKLNKKRSSNGKKPLFSTWTLKIDLDHKATKSTSGSLSKSERANPRVHLRRGHIRRYGSGLWIWVRACVVGNKNKGLIHKDYCVRKQTQREA